MLTGFKRWLRDTLERSSKTFVQAFLAVLFAGGVADVQHLRDVSAWQAAIAAGIAAVFSVGTSVLSKASGNPDNASADPHQP